MLWLRKIVFYVFALIYLILCPLIVARMLGFVINPQTHRLSQTGLVYVSTNPPDATVTIDGRQAHQKTPTAIRDLTPGKHFIRIELSDYNDWEGNVPIVGKKATVLANVLLIPEEWPIKIISRQPYDNIFFVPPDILIATSSKLKNINIFHTTQSLGENQKNQSLPALSQPLSRQEDQFLINGKNDLITRQGIWIRIYPKEDFGASQMYDIAKSKPSTNMYFEEKNGELFYLDNDTGFLSAAQILSYRPILNAPIPEALRIKISQKEPNL